MFTASSVVIAGSAEGFDCGRNLMVRAFSIAFKHGYGFMVSTYKKDLEKG